MISFTWNTYSNQKTYLAKVDRSAHNLGVDLVNHFGPPSGHLEFLGLNRRNHLILMEHCSDQKTYFAKNGRRAQKSMAPDHISRFGASWWPCGIFEVLIGGVICFSWNACSGKKIYRAKIHEAPKIHWVHPFPDRVGYFGAPLRQFWIKSVLAGMTL